MLPTLFSKTLLSHVNNNSLCILLTKTTGQALYLGTSSLPFAVETFSLYTVTDSEQEKTKVPFCGLGIPLSRSDTCFLPSQVATTVSRLLKQENTAFNGLVI